MNKSVIFIFAGICAISFCYVLVSRESSEIKARKKIDREILEAIKKIDKEVVLEAIKKLSNGSINSGNDSTQK